MKESALNRNDFCYKFENSYYRDNDIISILDNGITPENILNASRLIREKEQSRFLKLPVNSMPQVNLQPGISIEELPEITEAVWIGEELRAALESIELAGNEAVILRVLGPFSTLLQNVASNTLFKWLCKYKSEMHFALNKITEAEVAYINSALSKGANIISYAEPSAMAEVIGDMRYREFVIDYTLKLLGKIEANLNKSIVHICPKTSYQLERYGFVDSKVLSSGCKSYGQALIELAEDNNIKYIGHRCINAEDARADKIYVLRLI